MTSGLILHRRLTFLALSSIILTIMIAGCVVNSGAPTDNDDSADGDSVRFPDSGDRLIVASDPEDGDLLVFGDTATATVSRVRTTDEEVIYDVRFDGMERPTRANYNSEVSLTIDPLDDGRFDYSLSDNGALTGSGNGLTPASFDADETNPLANISKTATASRINELELLLCAGKYVGTLAINVCHDQGYTDAGAHSVLATELPADRGALNAGLLACTSYRAIIQLEAAELACRCSDAPSKDCCLRVVRTRDALHSLIKIIEAIIKQYAFEFLLDTTQVDPSRFCRPAAVVDDGTSCLTDDTCPDGWICGDDLTCTQDDTPSPTPVTNCTEANCRYCYLNTTFEANCPDDWNDSGDGCDCGCQFIDADCLTDDDDVPDDDVPDDDMPDDMTGPVGTATVAVCPQGLVTQHGLFGETLRNQTIHSFFQFSDYHGECRYVRADGVDPDRMLRVDIYWTPPDAGTPSGACGRADEGDIVAGDAGARLSTQRTIYVIYAYSTPIIDRTELLDELLHNAVQAGVGAACP